ncbi:MAG: hypothetical protein RLY20_3497 [Verrucomicrobiota bacterium]|jgi:photosystem II stability/assembly factor-like uncharacterized protein
MKCFTCLLLLGATLLAEAQTPVWTQLPNSPGSSGTRHDDIYFTDPTNGWATHNNNIYRTTNGGVTWTTNLTMPGTHFRSIAFLNPMVGFAGNLGVGSYDGNVSNTNVMYKTTDGGVTWTNVPGFAEAGMKGLCTFHVLNSNTIYGAGRVRGPAFVIKSSDGGSNWTMQNLTASNVMNGIMDVYFKDTNNGWVVGMDTNQYASPPYYGRIARTTNGGASWQVQVTTSIQDCYFWKISFPSPQIGYVALQQNLSTRTNIVFYKTTDGGETWVSNGIPEVTVKLNTNGLHFYLQGLAFVSTNEGWIGGASSVPYESSFLHTTNGGVSWEPAGYTNTWFINRIRFLSPTLGFAAGGNLHIYSVPLALMSQPPNLTVVGPTNVNLSVGAVGTPNLSYQWKRNGTNAPNGNGSTLILTNLHRSDSATYSVFVSNGFTNVQSTNAILRIIVPERLSQPAVLPGNKVQLMFTDNDGGALLTTNDLASFTVLASTNLVNWFSITNALSVTNGSIIFQDTLTNAPQKFYRVLEQF